MVFGSTDYLVGLQARYARARRVKTGRLSGLNSVALHTRSMTKRLRERGAIPRTPIFQAWPQASRYYNEYWGLFRALVVFSRPQKPGNNALLLDT